VIRIGSLIGGERETERGKEGKKERKKERKNARKNASDYGERRGGESYEELVETGQGEQYVPVQLLCEEVPERSPGTDVQEAPLEVFDDAAGISLLLGRPPSSPKSFLWHRAAASVAAAATAVPAGWRSFRSGERVV
jgi:hypothetical protein